MRYHVTVIWQFKVEYLATRVIIKGILYFRKNNTEIVCLTQSCERCVQAFEGENLEMTHCKYSRDIVVAIDGASYQPLENKTFCYMPNPEIIQQPSRNSTIIRYFLIKIMFKMTDEEIKGNLVVVRTWNKKICCQWNLKTGWYNATILNETQQTICIKHLMAETIRNTCFQFHSFWGLESYDKVPGKVKRHEFRVRDEIINITKCICILRKT